VKIPESITQAPILFLTGAGASAPLGLHPTRAFLRYFLDGPLRQLEVQLDTHAQPDLQKAATQLRVLASPDQIDIERILSILELSVDHAKRLQTDRLFVDMVLHGNVTELARFQDCDQVLRDLIYREVIRHYDSIDTRAAASLYGQIFVDFRKWLGQIPRVGATIPIFTLNYDRAVEAAASQLGIRLVDGLQDEVGATERRWSRSAFEKYREEGDVPAVILIKLHGSVRWGRRNDDIIVELPSGVGHNPGELRQVVLYPSEQLKPMHIEPFWTAYRLFRQCLNSARLLMVIGCSLRDLEIQTAIADAMDDNPHLHLLLFGPEADEKKVVADLNLDEGRVVAVRKFFEPAQPNQSENAFMACLRGFAQTACGVGGELGGNRYFRFGQTYEDWPWPSKESLARMIPSPIRRRHRFGSRS
jgi:hypothetical protein